ncbi:DUF4234 domain-containing protein [Clostridium gasigenes]|uniref:DUF4234 domain-containing protein n=1 Tax=Clostridium gasigenes TaxID=94869 RepID=UPI0014383B2A|nr:DUF4234 domain-containing protein [Clostridium gasigenes]NKF07676.1 DUF4234 domain-containing protein [Clostridium gasigenes]QSW18102.1 DUF4234 domain-containing protein [Clostridium gasigenes]
MIKNRSFWSYILLTIITFGIYGIIFMYNYTEDLNKTCEGTGKPSKNYLIVILLSIITCGIYYYVWLYKQANRINQQGFSYSINIPETGSTILLWNILGSLLCGVGPLVGQYLMIKNFNLLAEEYNRKFAN